MANCNIYSKPPQKSRGFEKYQPIEMSLPKPAPPKGKNLFVFHDKEHLYVEAVKLKQNMDQCKEENFHWKAKLKQYEKEVDKRDKIIQDLLLKVDKDQGTNQSKVQRPSAETHLVSALKKQIKNMKEEMRQKDEETTKLTKNLRITGIQELDVEIKMFSDECTRLKHIIEEIMKQKAVGYTEQDINNLGERMNQQSSLLNNIKQESNQIAGILQKKEEEIKNWKEVLEKLEKKIKKFDSETKGNLRLRKSLNESKKEIQNLKDQLAHVKVDNKDKQIGAFRAKIDEILRKQREISEKIELKEKKIKGLEDKLAEIAPQKNPADNEKELEDLRKKAIECKII